MADLIPEIDTVGELRQLRAELAGFVRDLPGALSAVSACIGNTRIEVTWADWTAPAPDPVVHNQSADSVGTAGQVVVTAPLVGTFYRAPGPGERPFVDIGDRVEPGQPIGIVEAMKLMNQVPCEHAGIVVEVLVADATAVEFGQPLVRIEPAAG